MDFIDYLDSRYDIEFVSGRSQVKVSGQCPFCLEDRFDLRMYVDVDTGIGICFHCNQGFNAVKFVMAAESCGWRNAVSILSDEDDEYKRGLFAIQCHNPGMTIEAKELYYRDLGP